MEAHEEKSLARKILSLDREAHDELAQIPMGKRILDRRGLRAEQTVPPPSSASARLPRRVQTLRTKCLHLPAGLRWASSPRPISSAGAWRCRHSALPTARPASSPVR